MPRKVDENQPAIVQGLRQCGALVLDLHELGKGAPDILVGWQGALHLIEIKAPHKGHKLTLDETAFHSRWVGYPVHVCETLADVLRVIGAQ